MRQFITIKCGVLLAGAVLVSLLACCAADTGAPVVTEDDLTPFSTVQDVIVQDAGGGKTYAYFWLGEALEQDPERVEQIAARLLEDSAQNLRTALETEGLPEEERASLEAQLEEYESRRMYDEILDTLRDMAREQQRYDPVIPPQEAANRAGWMLEQLYGLDLTGKELFLSCYQSAAGDVFNRYGGRMVWDVNALDGPLVAANVAEQVCASCVLDATTGELVEGSYLFTEEEQAAMEKTPAAAAYLPGNNGWDTQHPGYAQTADAACQQLVQAFLRSPLADGAAVTGTKSLEDQYTVLAFRLSCDNGKNYEFTREYYADPYIQYDCEGYPLRAYQFQNEAYS